MPTSRSKGRENFAMGGVLGKSRFDGLRSATVGKMGHNDKIVPTVLAKQAPRRNEALA